MSSRSPGRQKSVMLKKCWRHLQDMSWRPTNVFWDITMYLSLFITTYYILLCIGERLEQTDWYQVNIIITETKHIFVNIVCMTTQVKRYWKTIRKDASYMGRQESSSKKLTTRRGVKKSNNNYVYLLLSTRILKAFYVNKTRGSHRHQIP